MEQAPCLVTAVGHEGPHQRQGQNLRRAAGERRSSPLLPRPPPHRPDMSSSRRNFKGGCNVYRSTTVNLTLGDVVPSDNTWGLQSSDEDTRESPTDVLISGDLLSP